MLVTIELLAGPSGSVPTVHDVQRNINALKRATPGDVEDAVLIRDTISILEAIQKVVGVKSGQR
jgi:hypothetical protein